MVKKTRRKTTTIKSYVLDSNILLHDPDSMFQFENNHVYIPVEVLEEIDNFKAEQTERGANARRVNRSLDALFAQSPTRMKKGVDLPNGGRLSVIINPMEATSASLVRLQAQFPDFNKMDNRILAAALYVQETQPPPTVFVTKDIGLRLKALSLGLRAEDYLTDKKNIVSPEDEYREVMIPDPLFARFHNEGRVTTEKDLGLEINEYALLVNETNPSHKAPCRYYGSGEFRKLITPLFLQIPKGIVLKPRSYEQAFLMDAILDSSIHLVTVTGKAGTGKTIVSIGTALALLGREDSPYDGLTISRPVVTMGKDIGALPGGIAEKLDPFLRPYYDSLSVLMPMRRVNYSGQPVALLSADPDKWSRKDRKHIRKHKQTLQQMPNGQQVQNLPLKPWEVLQRLGILEIEALQFIRGRSIPRRLFLLDEAQHLTPHEAKTVVTRMAEGSKIILLGDPHQIDHPLLDAKSNGLVYTQNKTRNQSLAVSVKLTKGERSPLAEMATNLL